LAQFKISHFRSYPYSRPTW